MPHSCNHARAITCPHGWVPFRRSLRPGRAETYDTLGSCAHGMVSGRIHPVNLARRAKRTRVCSARSVMASSIRTRCQVGGARSQGGFKQWVPRHHDPALPLPDLLLALAKALPTILLTACPLLPGCTSQPECHAARAAGVEHLGLLCSTLRLNRWALKLRSLCRRRRRVDRRART